MQITNAVNNPDSPFDKIKFSPPAFCLYFFSGIIYAALVLILLFFHPHLLLQWLVFTCLLIIAVIIASLPYKSHSQPVEFSIVFIIWLIFGGKNNQNSFFVLLPVIAAMLVSLSYKLVPKLTGIFVCFLTAAWFLLGCYFINPDFGFVAYFLSASTFAMLAVYIISIFSMTTAPPRKIDLLLCSYSGNTAHCAQLFCDGARQNGSEVTVHRFHRFRQFVSSFEGDSFVVAFPIIGCKPPWPLLSYLLFKLPRGKSKPAYIIYTSAGGPENASFLVWAILTVKGYRVKGRTSAVYPMNVATFRLGPAKLWKFFDSLLPSKKTASDSFTAGADFTKGISTGLPAIYWPTPFFLFGIIIDNKLIDTLYRNHLFHKRCTGCGICVNHCPAQRLQMVNGLPRAKGTCTICMSCVNLCPQNAMHLWGFTEYGNPYPPKYKQFTNTHNP